MRVPNYQKGYVSQNKLEKYLLSETHSVGKAKSKFFHRIGFTKANTDILRSELLQLLSKNDYREAISTEFGIKYVVEGTLDAPFQSQIKLRTIWIIDEGQEIPRFITAYPAKN